MTRIAVGLLLFANLLPMAAFADTSDSGLVLTPSERSFFQLGESLGQAAFADAGLAQEAERVSKIHGRLLQLQKLAALDTLAKSSRSQAQTEYAQAIALMTSLDATTAALAPVQAAAERLDKPVSLSPDARTVSAFSHRAADTLGTLDEYNALSALPENKAIFHWLIAPTADPSSHVWYAEGLIAALAQTAAQRQMPELLPPVKEIATDLRGLQDWLALRLPDDPTPDQNALEAAIDSFLQNTSRTGVPQTSALSEAQLQALGAISQSVQAEILGTPPPVRTEMPAQSPSPSPQQ